MNREFQLYSIDNLFKPNNLNSCKSKYNNLS